jgi:chromosomal replication initiator protein
MSNINRVINAVAEAWNLQPSDITGPRRTGKIAQARQASMAICYWQGMGSLYSIAKAHGRGQHATVIHACNSVEADTQYDSAYRQLILSVTQSL